MRQHRPFRAAGRARGVEDRRQIVACARDSLEHSRRGGDSPGEGSIALHAEAFDPRQAELQRERPDRLDLIGAAENERGLGVAEEIFEFGKRIGGVQRQEDRAGAKAGERDHDHVGRFVDLRRDPVAGLDAKRDKRMSRLGRAGEKLAVSQGRGVGGLERELIRVRRPRGDEIEEIGGMRSRHLALLPNKPPGHAIIRQSGARIRMLYCRSIEPDITGLQSPPMKVRDNDAVLFFGHRPHPARSSQIDALSDGGFETQRQFGPQMRKEPDKRDVRAAGRRVFEHAMQRRKHSRLKVRALFCVFDIEMNSRRFVAGQMGEEDIHARLCSPQRGSITQFGDNEWRAATREAGRMPARLNIRRIKRARLGDRRGVEIANDPELLRRGQRRSRDDASIRVDCHSDESGYFLEHHVPEIEARAETRALARQDKRRADVWMARKRHFGARRENAHPGSVRGIVRRQDKRCLGQIELIGDRLHLCVRKAARIGNHGQRVAAELPVGEDIDRLELHFHERCVLRLVAGVVAWAIP